MSGTAAWEGFDPLCDCLTLEASADLSASQHCYCNMDSNGQVAISATAVQGLGILRQPGSAINLACQVQTGGFAIAKAGAAITGNGRVPLIVTTGGALIKASGDDVVIVAWSVGRLPGAAGNLFTVQLCVPYNSVDLSDLSA